MTEYLGVAGTHGTRREDEWNHLGSPFTKYLLRRGFVSVEERALAPFYWSTDLDFGGKGMEDWKALAAALFYYHVPALGPGIPGSKTRLICHSHAGQGAIIAAADYGLKIDSLITVGTPVIGKLDETVERARPNIKRWLHLWSPWDWTQIAGELWDGSFFKFRRKFTAADRNDEMPKGHGDVLRDPFLFHHWVDQGWLSFLKGDDSGAKGTDRSSNG